MTFTHSPQAPQVAAKFLRIIADQAQRAIGDRKKTGRLQLSMLDGDETIFRYKRFLLDDVEAMIAHALKRSAEGCNIYVEGRTVRPDARWRGKLTETAWVFALVIDSDADRDLGWTGDGDASLVVETSPGNKQYWFFLREAITAEEARAVGAAMRASTKTDSDSGVITQPYRLAGLPNYPNSIKRARGRTTCGTKILAHGGRRWSPAELLEKFPAPAKPKPIRRSNGHAHHNGHASTESMQAILKKYPTIRYSTRRELLGSGQVGAERRHRFHYRLANELHEAGVPEDEAFVLLRDTAWNKHGDDDPIWNMIEKIW